MSYAAQYNIMSECEVTVRSATADAVVDKMPADQMSKGQKVKEIIVLIKARSFLDELNLEHLTS